MGPTEQIDKFKEFIESNYLADILESVRKGFHFFIFDFSLLSKFDPNLAEDLLEHPLDVIKASELAIGQLELTEEIKNFKIRFKNLPEGNKVFIRDIRAKHIGKFLFFDGVVKQKTDVRPQVTTAKFECPSCGNTINVIQLDQNFREPTRCGCGRKGKFKLASKELIDAQGLTLEEDPNDLEGGAQPKRMKVLLKEDLVKPITEKRSNPGSKVRVVGIVEEVPIILKTGGRSTRSDLMIDANYVEPLAEDFSEINISPEEIEKFKEISNDKYVFEKLVKSVAPSIYGFDKVKEALILQLVGGVTKERDDGVRTRGDMHILLIGDPGCGKCLEANSKIILQDGSIVTIKELFNNQKNEFIEDGCYSVKKELSVISINESGKLNNNTISRLWLRKSPKKLLKILTRSGNEITVTKNHPFFTTKDGLIKPACAQDLKEGDYIATPKKLSLNCSIQTINFKQDSSEGHNKHKINVPNLVSEDLARLMGYLTGDGYVRFRKTTGITSFINTNKFLLDDFQSLIRNLFNLCVSKRLKKNKCFEYYVTSIDLVRLLKYLDENITFKSDKVRVPDIICKSPNNILKHFLIGLFESEGHVSRSKIELTSKSKDLTEDLKICLLRFGIQSQISKKSKYASNTIKKIRRTYYELRISGIDTEYFRENIGFITEKKKKRLDELCNVKNRNTNKHIIPNLSRILRLLRLKYKLFQRQTGLNRSTYLHYERGDRMPTKEKLLKIVNTISKIKNQDDVILNLIKELANTDIFWDRVKSIKTVKAKEDFVYDIEVIKTHNFMSNGIVVHNSQLLKRMSKVSPKARYVSGKGVSVEFNEPLLIKEKNRIKTIKIGEFVDKYSENKENIFVPLKKRIQALSVNTKNKKVEWRKISHVYRHRTKQKLLKFQLESGRYITVTKDHSIYTLENGKLSLKKSKDLNTDDYVIVPNKIPTIDNNGINSDIARLLGYFIAEGHLNSKIGQYYKIEFTLGKKDERIVKDLKKIFKNQFYIDIKIRKHGENGLRLTANGKEVYNNFIKLLGDVAHKTAKEKRVPLIIFNSNKKNRNEFINAYIDGDAGVTKSEALASDILYLLLQDSIIGSYSIKYVDRISKIRDHYIQNKGFVFELKSPNRNKVFNHRYNRPPFTKFGNLISTYFCKKMKSSKYSRVTKNTISNKMLLNRIKFIYKNKKIFGKKLKKLFGESILEYINEHQDFFSKTKVGRNSLISLNKSGNKLIEEIDKLYSFLDCDLGFVRIKKITKVTNKNKFVYDICVPKYENFVAGFGGILCHNTGAGLTAAVVKDEFLGGWALEAGALVLANKGFVMIDEMDKMSDEDRSAMHEALEQQCLHYDTRITLADGTEIKIGDFVEEIMSNYPEQIIKGHNCFILPTKELNLEMFTTDWKNIFKTKIDKVSKHIAEDYFIEIIVGNGRKILVTPEHPVFVVEDGKIITKRADHITTDDFTPVPLELPVTGKTQYFDISEKDIFNIRSNSHITIPMHNDNMFYKIIGYLLTEGSTEKNRGKIIGFNFTNKDKIVLTDFIGCVEKVFNIKPYIQERHKGVFVVRYISRELGEFINKVVPEIICTSKYKTIPKIAVLGKKDDIKDMLRSMFEGDGHVSLKKRTIRVGYASNSRIMCEQMQDLLLRFGIRSNLTSHKESYKVSITGYDNLWKFRQKIGFVTDKKNKIIDDYLSNIKKDVIRSVKDVIPNCQNIIIDLLKKYNIKTVGKNKFSTMKHDYLIKKKGVARKKLIEIVKALKNKNANDPELEFLNNLATGDIGFEKVRSTKRVKNTDQRFTYDVTIEPNHTFVSQNMVLHNTVSISKANIQATLKCETTVLAAANPKFGRFDPYDVLAKQIDMPPALINRFDLIFPIKDVPEKEKDKIMASHILNLHKNPNDQAVEYDTETLRKFISYIRSNIKPELSNSAIEEIQNYYVDMRNSGSNEGGIKSVPISARQLEALIRLSEASAKVRMRTKVTKEDAKRAIDLLQFCLQQIATDAETGKIDIDRISSGISASQRNKIGIVKDIVAELENSFGKNVPIEEVAKACAEKGISEDSVEEIIQKLKRSGDIFEPKRGFVSKI